MNKTLDQSVAAIITTYKRPTVLGRAIRSIVSQTHPAGSLTVIDNDPQASAKAVVKNLEDEHTVRIRYICEPRSGASAARNRGILEAELPYIAFLDDDDVWEKTHLSQFAKCLAVNPGLVLFGGYLARLGKPEQLILPVGSKLFAPFEVKEERGLLLRSARPLEQPFFTPSMSTSVIRTDAARQIMFDEDLAGREDIYFVWLISQLGDIVIDQEVNGYADQLDTSLFSVSAQATPQERLAMDLKKADNGVKMLERLMQRIVATEPMVREFSAAHFDASYFHSKAGHTRQAFAHCWRSFKAAPSPRHLRLLLGILRNTVSSRD